MRAIPSPLLVVTDRHGHPRPLVETVQAALDGGARGSWLRERDLPPAARRRLGEEIAGRVRSAGGILTVGGDPTMAADLGADGVHLHGTATSELIAVTRRTLGPSALIGLSAHAAGDAAHAASGGADYATLSPIYASSSKPGYGPALGPEGIAAAVDAGLPVLALGGLAVDRIPACRRRGASGIAVMGALMRADDPGRLTREILDAWAAAGPSGAAGRG